MRNAVRENRLDGWAQVDHPLIQLPDGRPGMATPAGVLGEYHSSMSWTAWPRLWTGLLVGTLLTGCSALPVVSYLPKFSETPPEGSPPVRHVQVAWPTLRYGHSRPAKGSHALGYCPEVTATDRLASAGAASSLHYFCPTAERTEAPDTSR